MATMAGKQLPQAIRQRVEELTEMRIECRSR